MHELFPLSVERSATRIERNETRLSCYVSTRLDAAREEARERKGPLAGVPFGLKDEFDTPNLPTTGGSWRHRDRRTPGFSSAPFRAFDEAGAVLMGKTNLSDMGLAPEASSWVGGSTKNPFDATRTSGGSSGGSAAAVAYGLHAFDWGTDIGGSIRLPAAFCGVLGLKLSDETWPLQELFPSVPDSMRWLCGQGPFTRDTAQMRCLLEVARPLLRNDTPARPFSLRRVELYAPEPGAWGSFGAEVGPFLERALDVPSRDATALAPPPELLAIFAGIWASHFEDLLASDESIGLADGLASVLRSVFLRGTPFDDRAFHPVTAELLLLIALGRVTFFRDREAARRRAFAVKDTFADLWADGALVVAPVTAHPPPKILRSNWNRELLSYTAPGNLADATGLSIPFGTFDGRLPRSIQLLGPPGCEALLLELADRIIAERDRDPSLRQPRTDVGDA